MTSASRESDYVKALAAHVQGGGEEALSRAYDIGRCALVDGLGLLDMATMHHEALSSMPATWDRGAAIPCCRHRRQRLVVHRRHVEQSQAVDQCAAPDVVCATEGLLAAALDMSSERLHVVALA